MLRWAREKEPLYSASLAANKPVDDLMPPRLTDGELYIYNDFFDLSTERQIGMGPGPIPASAIERHTAGWPYDAAWMFRHCIREMDRAYLAKPDEPTEQTCSDNPARDAFRHAFRDKGRRI